MKQLALPLVIAACLGLAGCASTKFFGPDGKPRFATQGNLQSAQFLPDGSFSITGLTQDTNTLAGGDAVAHGIDAVTSGAAKVILSYGAKGLLPSSAAAATTTIPTKTQSK